MLGPNEAPGAGIRWEISPYTANDENVAAWRTDPKIGGAGIQVVITGGPGGRAGRYVRLSPRPWADLYSYHPYVGSEKTSWVDTAKWAQEQAAASASEASGGVVGAIGRAAESIGADRGVMGIASTILTGTPPAAGDNSRDGGGGGGILGIVARGLGLDPDTFRLLLLVVVGAVVFQMVTGRSVLSLARGK